MNDNSRSLNGRPAWLTSSAIVLIVANLVPLAGALLFYWTVFEIIVLFWAENVLIGALNVLRMSIAAGGNAIDQALKFFLIPFFVLHYGMFTYVHGCLSSCCLAARSWGRPALRKISDC